MMSSDECGQYYFEDFEELEALPLDDSVGEIRIGVEDKIELEEK